MELSWVLFNAVVSFASAFAAVTATVDPASLSGSSQVTSGERFYQHMYSVRAIPLEMLAAVLPFYFRSLPIVIVVATSAVVQALDAVIGLNKGEVGMACGALFATGVHTMCCLQITRDYRANGDRER